MAAIISYTSSNVNSPDWFEVILKDGTVLEFGNSLTSRFLTDGGNQTIMWRLSKLTDISGNYIQFEYENSDRTSRIAEIAYTGNDAAGLTPYNFLTFEYSVRTDKNLRYLHGASIQSKYLLEKIVSINRDNPVQEIVRSYKLHYATDNVSSFLKEIEEVGGLDMVNVSLNSTIFQYGEKPQDFSIMASDALNGTYDHYTGDFDGDGKTDVVLAGKYFNQNLNTFLHTNYSLISDITPSGYTLMYQKLLPTQESSVNFANAKFSNFMAADYDGDGRDDVIQSNSSVVLVSPCQGYCRAISDIVINHTKEFNSGTGFTDYTMLPIPIPNDNSYYYQYASQNGNFIIPGDFNGDGNQDFILVLGSATQNGQCPGPGSSPKWDIDYKPFFTSPSTNEINEEVVDVGTSGYSSTLFAETVAEADFLNVIDFNGDGKMEVLVTKDQVSYIFYIHGISSTSGYSFQAEIMYSTGQITEDSKRYFGDFNNDAITDILVKKDNNASWKILYGTAVGYNEVAFDFNQTINHSQDKLITGDFNGDGKSDILHAFPNGSSDAKFSIYFSKGGIGTTGFYYEQQSYSNSLSAVDFFVGDFNGDGRDDVANLLGTGANGTTDFIYFKPYGKNRLLTKLTTGYNQTTSLDYKLVTDKSVYPYFYNRTISLDDPLNSNPFNFIELPIYALSSLTVPNGIGGNNITEYSYEDAVVHRSAKGFLGFKKITTKNNTFNTTLISSMAFDSYFAVPYETHHISKLTSTGALINESTITNIVASISSQDKRYLHKVTRVLTVDHVNVTASELANEYGPYGNIENSTVQTGYLNGNSIFPIEVIRTSKTFIAQNSPVASRPDNITIEREGTGSPNLSETTLLSYNSYGLVSSEVNFAGLQGEINKTFTYDVFGNIVTKTISCANADDRSEAFEYEPLGRFLIHKYRGTGTAIEQMESYTVDPGSGKPLSVVTSDCLTTTHAYDGFGRIIQSILPDNNICSYTYQLVNNPDYMYKVTREFYGSFPDEITYYDKLGRQQMSEKSAPEIMGTGEFHTKQTYYDERGNISKKTNSYFPNSEIPQFTDFRFDEFNRPIGYDDYRGSYLIAYSQAIGNGVAEIIHTNQSGQVSRKHVDAGGKVITSLDEGGEITFMYDSRGNQILVQINGETSMQLTYDEYGRKEMVDERNSGITKYNYDYFGQLIYREDARGNVYKWQYDPLGRLERLIGPNGNTDYQYYDNNAGCRSNRPVSVLNYNDVNKAYQYDALMRLISENVTIDGTDYLTNYEYNSFSQVNHIKYPGSGIDVFYEHDGKGYTTRISADQGFSQNFFTASAVDGAGRQTKYELLGGITTEKIYDNDFVKSIQAGNIHNYEFDFDISNGNLLKRRDMVTAQEDIFSYDNLHRLTLVNSGGVDLLELNYDGSSNASLGNIISKTDAGYYTYHDAKLNAVAFTMDHPAPGQATATLPPAPVIPHPLQEIAYTAFEKPETISEDGYELRIEYGPDNERVKTTYSNPAYVIETKYFIGNYELQETPNGTKEIHYVQGPDGICGLIVAENSITTSYAVFKDHLGSIVKITDENAVTVAEQSFDAWGRRRLPNDWTSYYPDVDQELASVPEWLYRGYTGHEMLPRFSMINMNARMYDPILGRMLSPDNFLQEPFNSQNFNRYSYCLNNPLKYTDPTGNFFLEQWVFSFASGLFSTGSDRWGTAWNEANRRQSNTGKLLGGLFQSDENRTFGGRIWEVASRFSWQFSQTLLGLGVNNAANSVGMVDDVQYFHGATVTVGIPSGGAFTLGSYISLSSPTLDAEANIGFGNRSYTLLHEYGHYLQSQESGPLYMFKYALPSSSGGFRNSRQSGADWTEIDANTRSARYFQRTTGFVWQEDPDDPGNRYRSLSNTIHHPHWFEYGLFFNAMPLPIVYNNRWFPW